MQVRAPIVLVGIFHEREARVRGAVVGDGDVRDVDSLYFPRGIILNKDLSRVLPYDQEQIKEFINHSWYEYSGGDQQGLHPWQGETKAKYDGYKGMFYITTANTERPGVYGRQRQPIAEGDREAPYSGCFVNTNITLWTQDNKFGKAIRANLRIVQFAKDGDSFGGGGNVVEADDFVDLSVVADDLL